MEYSDAEKQICKSHKHFKTCVSNKLHIKAAYVHKIDFNHPSYKAHTYPSWGFNVDIVFFHSEFASIRGNQLHGHQHFTL